jgi:FG-GAP-like repeat/FlgD Ig-like domain
MRARLRVLPSRRRRRPVPTGLWMSLATAGLLVVVAAAVLVFASPACGFEVVSTTPSHYALGVSNVLSTIQVQFDAPVALPSAGAVRVAGSMSGLHTANLSVNGSMLHVSNLAGSFLPGELVHVNLRSDVHAVAGGGLSGGRYFAFTIASTRITPDWSDVTVYPTASVPYFIHGGDLDGDNRPDLAVPNEGTHDVSVFLNLAGDGTFNSHFEYGVGQRPSSIFGEDLDNDGDQDLVTADINSSTLSVLRNNGSGIFTAAGTYAAGITTRQVHGGDFDGDNDVDVCATSRGTDEIYVFLNNGHAGFSSFSIPVAGGPFAIRTGDFDGDMLLDIAVACQDADSLEVLLNQGGALFVSAGRWAIGNGPWCLNGNDYDGDGDFDLVSVATFANRIALLRNDGAGGFASRTLWATGVWPLGVFAADLDGDGDIDATSANYSSATVGIYLNDGTGNLVPSGTLPTTLSASYAWAHDLDGDGDLDISIVDEESNQLFVYRNGGTAVDVDGGNGLAGALVPSLSIAPNPMRAGGRVRLALAWNRAGDGATPALAVYDVAGRLVRRLDPGRDSSTLLEFTWDGRDARGREVASGRYWALTHVDGRRISVPVQIVP